MTSDIAETKQPNLRTERLLLKPFDVKDAQRVQLLAGSKEIADMTATIPYPYPDGVAESWIKNHPHNWSEGVSVTYAIGLQDLGEVVGCISLVGIKSDLPELGFWIGKNYWGNGYCTEACRAVLNFGSQEIGLKTIYGRHLERNLASGRVLERCGLKFLNTGIEEKGRMKGETFKLYSIDFK